MDITHICPSCPRYTYCHTLCHPISCLADNQKSLREKLLARPLSDRERCTDYKEALVRLQRQARQRIHYTITDIRAIQDTRIKAIAALLYAHLKVRDIARILKLSPRHIRRIIQIFYL